MPNIAPIKAQTYSFGDYNYPLTTDIAHWGKVIKVKGNVTTLENDSYDDVFIEIETSSEKQTYSFYVDDKVIASITDLFGSSHNSFTRTINNQTFVISNGQVVFKTTIKPTRFISKIGTDKHLTNKFITLDIETRVINHVHSPYLISFYDGCKPWSFFLSDFKSIEDMLTKLLNQF